MGNAGNGNKNDGNGIILIFIIVGWLVGARQMAGRFSIPIYYSFDWAYDGLLIYTRVKEKIPSIELLYPNSSGRSIVETEHQSFVEAHKYRRRTVWVDESFFY